MYSSIEAAEYQKFLREYYAGKHGSKRLGQAVYDHFGLQKSTQNKVEYAKLYEADGELALAMIRTLFDLS